MSKKFEKNLIVAVPKDLFDNFKNVCDERYTTRSQEVRNFMFQFIKEHKNGEKSKWKKWNTKV